MDADPEAARAAEQIAAWAGISSGKREMIAATLLAARVASKDISLNMDAHWTLHYMAEALKHTDMLMKLSKENPPS